MNSGTEHISLQKLHKKFIKNTGRSDFVTEVTMFLCNLTHAVKTGVSLDHRKVYLKTSVLKHLYDKRPAQEYDSILDNLHLIVRYPDIIYKNKSSKRGSLCLTKEIDGTKYFAAIEQVPEELGNQIITLFKVNDKYLEGFKKIWSWEGGNPPS